MEEVFNFDFEKYWDKLIEKLDVWLEHLVVMIPNFLLAILTVLGFVLLARVGRTLARKVLVRATSNMVLVNLFNSILTFSIISIGLFVALGVLNLDRTVTSLLAGIGVVGLALGLAFQEIASNFISGVLLAFRTPFRIGDLVELNGIFGKVDETNLRTTVLRTLEGQEVRIPNKLVLQEPIKNYTSTGERRVDLDVGISYGEDLERVRDIVIDTIEKSIEARDKSKPVELIYTEFGLSSIRFTVRFWMVFENRNSAFLNLKSDAIVAIKKRFDQEGITIPFPIQTLDFGAKGGTPLWSNPLHVAVNSDQIKSNSDETK